MIARMLRTVTLAAFALASVCCWPALAQISGGGVGQSGPVTAGDCAQWVGNGLIKDSGAGCGGGGGSGTVTSVSVATANGISGSVANPTTTPAITLTLGAITPSSVAIGAGSAITSSGAGGALGSNAFTSTAYMPLAGGTFTGTVTFNDASTYGSSGISGTTINNSIIGGSTAAPGTFTALNATTLGMAGNITFSTANAVVGGSAGTSVALTVQTANQSGAFNASTLTLKGGNNSQASGTNNAGAVAITGGNASGAGSTGNGGGVAITLGTSVGGTAGQLTIVNLPQSAAAQSGTMCYSASGVTYDATLGCLTSLEELKDIHGLITGALAEVAAFKPFWFTPINRPAGSDLAEQPGFGAHQIETVDKRLVGYDEHGNLRGVRYMEITAVLAAAITELKTDFESYRARHP
jgi:hypothetical protein